MAKTDKAASQQTASMTKISSPELKTRLTELEAKVDELKTLIEQQQQQNN